MYSGVEGMIRGFLMPSSSASCLELAKLATKMFSPWQQARLAGIVRLADYQNFLSSVGCFVPYSLRCVDTRVAPPSLVNLFLVYIQSNQNHISGA